MKQTVLTPKTNRYQVISSDGKVLSVFSTKKRAVEKAFLLALEFKKDIFYVIRKNMLNESVILKISLNFEFNFKNAESVLAGIALGAKKKNNRIRAAYKKENW